VLWSGPADVRDHRRARKPQHRAARWFHLARDRNTGPWVSDKKIPAAIFNAWQIVSCTTLIHNNLCLSSVHHALMQVHRISSCQWWSAAILNMRHCSDSGLCDFVWLQLVFLCNLSPALIAHSYNHRFRGGIADSKVIAELNINRRNLWLNQHCNSVYYFCTTRCCMYHRKYSNAYCLGSTYCVWMHPLCIVNIPGRNKLLFRTRPASQGTLSS